MNGTPSVSVDSGQDMARPERVTCGSCVRFQPGTTKMGIGRCLATDGMDASPLHRTGSGEFQKGVLA